MSTVRRWVKGGRHARLVSLKRQYAPDFTPRHAKPSQADDTALMPGMELAA